MQTTARVHVTFNNPATPACTLDLPVRPDVGKWVQVMAALNAEGIVHPQLDYWFDIDAVRAVELLGCTTTC